MSPTSRNTLMIGGALIVVALLLTCGPLKNWLGGADRGAVELPSVAAGPPPVDAAGALGAAVAGAAAGAQIGASNVAGTPVSAAAGVGGVAGASGSTGAAGAGQGSGAGLKAAGVAGLAAGAGAVAAASAGGAGGAGAAAAGASAAVASAPASPASVELPAVSAGVPNTNVSAPMVLAAAAAITAVGAFDDAFADDSDSAAGRVVDRFAPPVAAVGESPLDVAGAAAVFGIQGDAVRRPCDSPGAGCQNINGGINVNPGPNPPIIPGIRPIPVPAGPNPPIIPGVRPVPVPGQI